jgi:hypothetical protein
MEYTSLSWSEVRLHEDRLHEFCYPLSNLCHKWTDRFSLYWLQVMSFVFAHDLSPWDRLHEFCLCHKWTLICLVCTDCRSFHLSSLMTYHHGIVFMNFFCVTKEHWYVWFVLIAGHVFCFRSWLVTMCDIWPVVGISSIMNVTCGTGPYLPS